MTKEQEKTVRDALVAEARTWIGTRFHHEAFVKGAGVDCGNLLIEVHRNAGLPVPDRLEHYPRDFMLHRDEEMYTSIVERFAFSITEPLLPGDVALFKIGRVFSHGGIVVQWPLLIHASASDRMVVLGSADAHPLQGRARKFYRHNIFRGDRT